MIQKIKNWLIKKLGGYTAAEYNHVNRISEIFSPPREYPHEELCATVEVPAWRLEHVQQCAVREALRLKLAAEIDPYMAIETCDDIENMTTKFRGRITVVRKRWL